MTGNRTKNKETIEYLKKHEWIDKDTRAIQVMFNLFSVWTNTYYYNEINIELPYSDDHLYFKEMKTINLYFYKGINNQEFTTRIQTGELVFYSLLLINSIIFTNKIMFEFQLSISKITNATEFINVILNFLIIVTKFVEIILKNRQTIDFGNHNKFLDLSTFMDLEKINTYGLALCCFFFPFRVLSYFAHFEYFSPAKTVMNTITRTSPGVLIYVIIGLIISLGWALCMYIPLSKLYPQFSTF